MKTFTTVILILLSVTISNAQQILDISQDNGYNPPPGTYFKDIHNVLDQFAGTYQISGEHFSIKFIFQKKIAADVGNGNHKEDLIVGGYQYMKDGTVLVNTLDQLNLNLSDAWNYIINGNLIITGQYLGCDDCGGDEQRLLMGIEDDESATAGEMEVRRITIDSQPAIKVRVTWNAKHITNGIASPKPKFPSGEYILLKQL